MRSLSKFVPFNSSIWKFLTFNTGLPLFDMGTDFRTFFFYLSVASFHPNWAMLTLGWILHTAPDCASSGGPFFIGSLFVIMMYLRGYLVISEAT